MKTLGVRILEKRKDLIVSSVATNKLEAEPKAESVEVAVLAGGCFWGVEDILRDVPGVIDT